MNRQILPVAAIVFALASLTASAAVDAETEKFMKDSALCDMAEIQMGKMAQEKGTDAKVRDLGRDEADGHTQTSNEMKQLADKLGVALPVTLDDMHQKKVDKLNGMSGADFDWHYTNGQVAGHEKGISELEKYIASGQNQDVKAFASKTLPTLKGHLDHCRGLLGTLKKGTAEANLQTEQPIETSANRSFESAEPTAVTTTPSNQNSDQKIDEKSQARSADRAQNQQVDSQARTETRTSDQQNSQTAGTVQQDQKMNEKDLARSADRSNNQQFNSQSTRTETRAIDTTTEDRTFNDNAVRTEERRSDADFQNDNRTFEVRYDDDRFEPRRSGTFFGITGWERSKDDPGSATRLNDKTRGMGAR